MLEFVCRAGILIWLKIFSFIRLDDAARMRGLLDVKKFLIYFETKILHLRWNSLKYFILTLVEILFSVKN